jgi:hypothetical protein
MCVVAVGARLPPSEDYVNDVRVLTDSEIPSIWVALFISHTMGCGSSTN